MAIDPSLYHRLADEVLLHIGDTIDNGDFELDFEPISGLLELDCIDGSQIVINKQEALCQIWVATKFNGHHFDYIDGKWIDARGGGELYAFLSAAIEKQGGEKVSF